MVDKGKYFMFDNRVWKLITKHPRLKDMNLEQQTIMKNIKKQHLIVWKALNCLTNEILLCVGVPKDTKLYKSEKMALEYGNQ